MSELKIISLNDIESKEVEWLWKPYIPLGKLTIIEGDPGSGKTKLALQLASQLSNRVTLPFFEEHKEPMNIIYQTVEDSYDDTIKPRLEKMLGNYANIHFIDESKDFLYMSDERIEQAIIRTNAKLLVLDPVQSYLGANVNMNSANEVRSALNNLVEIAKRTECAIVIISHLNKKQGLKAINKHIGSMDLAATARSVLLVGEIKGQEGKRAMAHVKSSLCRKGKTLEFEITDNGFIWHGESELTEEEILAGVAQKTKKQIAMDFIEEMLVDGPRTPEEIYKKGTIYNISKRTIDEAKKVLNVKSVRLGTGWYWQINND